jgi:hypothetical protein
MSVRTFSSFLTSKERENKEHLNVIQKLLERAGFQVTNKLDDDKEPYVYIHKPVDADPILEGLSFGGARLYTRGSDLICYRSQNKSNTEPFGTTYFLDVKGMFKDLVKEHDKDKIGHRIIFYIIQEMKNFFVKSARAEKEGEDDGQMGSVVMGTTGTDYANQATDLGRNR